MTAPPVAAMMRAAPAGGRTESPLSIPGARIWREVQTETMAGTTAVTVTRAVEEVRRQRASVIPHLRLLRASGPRYQ